jgi:hypothetical protein
MSSDYYRLGQGEKRKRRRWIWWLILLLLLLAFGFWGYRFATAQLKPETKITQAKPVIIKSEVNSNKTTHYDTPNFGIDIPVAFQQIPRPVGPYTSFTWTSSRSNSDGRKIEVFEDTIPVNYAVNRALIVSAEGDRLMIKSSPSENCVTFTRDLSGTQGQVGTPAKWEEVPFLCDRANKSRNVVGTSSLEGVNKVTLKSPTKGTSHTYFFAYSDQSVNPDYSLFLTALQSFRMK